MYRSVICIYLNKFVVWLLFRHAAKVIAGILDYKSMIDRYVHD